MCMCLCTGTSMCLWFPVVQKIAEVPQVQVQVVDEIVQVQKQVHVPMSSVVEVPVQKQVHVLRLTVVQETVEVPRLEYVERRVRVPMHKRLHGPVFAVV